MNKQAVLDELQREFDSIPPLEELKKMYEFSERHKKQMEKIFEDLRKQESIEQRIYLVRKIAIIFIALLAIAIVSVKFAPKVYAYFKAWIVEVKDDDSIEFKGNRSGDSRGASDTDENLLKFELGYMPEDYELESDEVSTLSGRNIVYRNSCGDTILIICKLNNGNVLWAVDIERAELNEVCINGVRYYIFDLEEGGTICLGVIEAYIFRFFVNSWGVILVNPAPLLRLWGF